MTNIDLQLLSSNYHEGIREEFEQAITGWKIDLHIELVHAVVGGLLARQCILATEFALSPELWNFSFGPLFIRSMVELFIDFKWIVIDPVPRCRDYHLYGLGQAKLAIQYARSLQTMEETNLALKNEELWLNSQRHEIFTDVNVGAWSGKTLKEMAIEANIVDSFTLYSSLAGAAHGTWDHLFQIYLNSNSTIDAKPQLPEQRGRIDFLLSSARILNDTFDAFYSFISQKRESLAYEELLSVIKSEDKPDE